jgi:hypothetical protein
MMETRLMKGFNGYPEKTEVEGLQSSDKILKLKEGKVKYHLLSRQRYKVLYTSYHMTYSLKIEFPKL